MQKVETGGSECEFCERGLPREQYPDGRWWHPGAHGYCPSNPCTRTSPPDREAAIAGDTFSHEAHARHLSDAHEILKIILGTKAGKAANNMSLIGSGGSTGAFDIAFALAQAGLRVPTCSSEYRARYEGEPCGECGNLTLVRNGTCMKCDTCGSTTR